MPGSSRAKDDKARIGANGKLPSIVVVCNESRFKGLCNAIVNIAIAMKNKGPFDIVRNVDSEVSIVRSPKGTKGIRPALRKLLAITRKSMPIVRAINVLSIK